MHLSGDLYPKRSKVRTGTNPLPCRFMYIGNKQITSDTSSSTLADMYNKNHRANFSGLSHANLIRPRKRIKEEEGLPFQTMYPPKHTLHSA